MARCSEDETTRSTCRDPMYSMPCHQSVSDETAAMDAVIEAAAYRIYARSGMNDRLAPPRLLVPVDVKGVVIV